MSKLLICLIAMVTLAGEVAAQESPQTVALEVVSENEAVSFDTQKQLTLRFWLEQLVLSALYRDVLQDSSMVEWQRQLSAPTRIKCRYAVAATLAIPERQTLRFDEVLLPLMADRYPDYIYIKNGQHVRRLAKYDPWVLHKLVSESRLKPYEQLAR